MATELAPVTRKDLAAFRKDLAAVGPEWPKQVKAVNEVVARKGEAPPADGEPLTLYELLRLHELGRPAQHEDPDEVP